MLAALLTLGLFLVWCVIGLAALVLVRADVRELRVALTAPILGTALTVIPLFVLNNAGVPMHPGALPVWGVLLVGSVAVLAWRPPGLPLAVVPVAILCLVELVLVGRPMFHFGFDWIANVNGDMGTYVLGAVQLIGHGLQSPVDFRALADNRDFATSVQTLNLLGLRPGTPIALAGLATGTGKTPLDLYMPMSIAIAMCGVCATGALAMQASRRWWAASVAGALFVVSPMAGYGVVQQLLPQDWGLGLAAALFAWLMRPEIYRKGGTRTPDVVVVSALAAALFIVAYEVATSLALAYGLFVVVLLVQRRVSLRAAGLLWGVPLVATAVVVNTFMPRALRYLDHHVIHFGTSGGFHGLPIFAYAVVPSAVPGAAGLKSIFASQQSPHEGLFVLAGAALFAGLLVASVFTALKWSAAGITLLGDLALGLILARSDNQFGLFKLYMYMQPFVAATVAVVFSRVRNRQILASVAVLTVVVVGFQLRTLDIYVAQSRDPVDLHHASEPDLLPKFRRLFATATTPVISVTDNLVLEELEGAATGDKPLYFLSRNIYGSPWRKRTFSFPSEHGSTTISFHENVAATRILSRGSCVVALPSGSQVAMNRRSFPEGSPDIVKLSCGKAKNVLAFIVSGRGQPATLPADRRKVGFWQLVSDPVFPGSTLAGFGRYALFEVLGPTPTVRVELDLTTSPLVVPSGSHQLPPAAVAGAGRAPFPIVGSGSARVISPPLRPRMIDGQPYLVLDMGRNGQFPVVARPGLTGLWGGSILLDPRLLTSYVRDISLVSPAGYGRLRAPKAIRSFPADLGNPDLEYSGIYEDGWIGQTSYAVLAGGPAGRLVIRANLLPRRRQGQTLRVVVNGRTVETRRVTPGTLNLQVAVPASAGRRKIELLWAGVTRLPPPDGRSVAAHLTFLGVS